MSREEVLKDIEKFLQNKELLNSREIILLVDFLEDETNSFDYEETSGKLFELTKQYYGTKNPRYIHISEEGGEGEGEYAEGVFQIDDVYYRYTYSYYSYNGYEYDYGSLYVVTPKEKLVTVYEAI